MRGTATVTLLVCAGLFVFLFYGLASIYGYTHARGGRFPLYRDFYECGFRATPDVRAALDVQFGLLGLIFLVYDAELILLAPILLNASGLPHIAQAAFAAAAALLGLSYWYEWERCALQWSFN